MNRDKVVIMLMLAAFSLTGCDACEENFFTKMGDNMATIGKDGLEKEKVLFERRANRAADCVESKAEKASEELGF